MSLLCSLPLIAAIANCTPAPFATGYVEGEYTLVAPVQTVQIRQVNVARGDHVPAGTVLAVMEQQDAEIALAQAQAQVAQSQSALANLTEGARPEEIAVIEANLAAARLQSAEADRNEARMVELNARSVVTDAQRDDAVTSAEVARAAIAQVEAQLAVAKLPARPQAIAEAEAAVRAAEAARDQAQWQLDQRTLTLPQDVTVMDVVRQTGEIAGPSAPVLSTLAEGAVKLRLYIPEASYAQVQVGDTLTVGCDGCAPQTATISYISDEPEFTPPVIYSLENRQKLVYLIEATPDAGEALKPGQIVSVTLP